MMHNWKGASAQSIKCDAGHYISRANVGDGVFIYTLHPANNGKLECFNTIKEAKKKAENYEKI